MSSPALNRSQARPVEEGDGSTRAVRGSPEPLSSYGDDENNSSTTAQPASQNSTGGSPRPKHLTRAVVRHFQDFQRGHDQPISSTDEILNNKDSLLLGLTPTPWPSDLIPHKKRPRSIGEILDDKDPGARDKLTAELDEMEMASAPSDSKKRKVDLAYRARQDGAGPSSRPNDREGRSEK